ncbi:PREDICTED: methionine aminopeptidase 1D, mitochondrial-like isoform X2 [Priapulus caudatus]|uniref:Methionine aminopeptidase n=1 Tax=Priapulus caudatus TaxID=37621 RepID=A0ABM1DYT6_PRICU|nr:PREDICTED: methionine aminopeptidase 1D, mitochondrial-like isoform X2 [Priapulus caudatus]
MYLLSKSSSESRLACKRTMPMTMMRCCRCLRLHLQQELHNSTLKPANCIRNQSQSRCNSTYMYRHPRMLTCSHDDRLLRCETAPVIQKRSIFDRLWKSIVGTTPDNRVPNEEPSFSLVTPQLVSPERPVPSYIQRPPYALSTFTLPEADLGLPAEKPIVNSEGDIVAMREACTAARTVLNTAADALQPGVTTDEIDRIVHETCISLGVYPSPLKYRGFPKSVCTSVNNVMCHGIPDDRPLQDGDIINVDVTVFCNGYHGDLSETYVIGEVDEKATDLIAVAKLCRDAAISACKPGQSYSVIGDTISYICQETGYASVPDFCGHGIGKYFHGPPCIIHISNNIQGVMEPGVTFTVEPIITEGKTAFTILDDGWTAVASDQSRSAQFEHTVLVTDTGVEILTL